MYSCRAGNEASDCKKVFLFYWDFGPYGFDWVESKRNQEILKIAVSSHISFLLFFSPLIWPADLYTFQASCMPVSILYKFLEFSQLVNEDACKSDFSSP